MFQILLQIFCEILLIFAAMKYLMPDIRKICKKIADGGETKEKEIRTKRPAPPVAITVKRTDSETEKEEKKEEGKEPVKQSEPDADDKGGGINEEREIPGR